MSSALLRFAKGLKPLQLCPQCNSDLTSSGGVIMETGCQEPPLVRTVLDSQGYVIDSGGHIANGTAGRVACSNCVCFLETDEKVKTKAKKTVPMVNASQVRQIAARISTVLGNTPNTLVPELTKAMAEVGITIIPNQ